jgi:hypothetical protein
MTPGIFILVTRDIPGVDKRRLASAAPHPFPDRDRMLILTLSSHLTETETTKHATRAHNESYYHMSLLRQRLVCFKTEMVYVSYARVPLDNLLKLN